MTSKRIAKYLKKDGISFVSGTLNGANYVGIEVNGRKFGKAVKNIFVPYLVANRKPIAKAVKKVLTAVSNP